MGNTNFNPSMSMAGPGNMNMNPNSVSLPPRYPTQLEQQQGPNTSVVQQPGVAGAVIVAVAAPKTAPV